MNLTAQVLRAARPLAVLALSAGLAGLGSTAALAAAPAGSRATQVKAAHGVGYLRLAHLSPNTPPVDVYLYSFGRPGALVVLRHVAYGTVSPYRPVTAGEYTVAMRAAGAAATSKPVLSTTVPVQAGHAYTVAGMGPKAGLRLQIIDDRTSSPPGGALVRVIQASLRQHQVTVTFGNQVIQRSQSFASVTPYRVLHPGTWTVHAAGGGEHASTRLTLTATSIRTLVVLDSHGRLVITSLVDAAGSKIAPAGGAATGYGGTAPGGSPVPWLALTGLGVLLTLGGIARLRTLRWARRAAAHVR
ncbi:MAG TPA: DUF4397 domain-containing protein [Streptosporangiaceae bacterium]|jgi:hypothetical protein